MALWVVTCGLVERLWSPTAQPLTCPAVFTAAAGQSQWSIATGKCWRYRSTVANRHKLMHELAIIRSFFAVLSQDIGALCAFQVVVVLQQVFALIQTVLSKWLNDSQVVEVSRLRPFAHAQRVRRRWRHVATSCPPSGGVRHLWKVCQDAAPRLRSHGVSAERDARADVQHDSTGLGTRPHATGTLTN